jgi:hypothetical protein
MRWLVITAAVVSLAIVAFVLWPRAQDERIDVASVLRSEPLPQLQHDEHGETSVEEPSFSFPDLTWVDAGANPCPHPRLASLHAPLDDPDDEDARAFAIEAVADRHSPEAIIRIVDHYVQFVGGICERYWIAVGPEDATATHYEVFVADSATVFRHVESVALIPWPPLQERADATAP